MKHATQSTQGDHAEIDAIHDFWFAEPAGDPAQLLSKFARWYQGGAEVDREIVSRFSTTIERALRGELEHWRSHPRGELALILVLDQFTRNVFRDTPRAYAGDARALELALALLDGPHYRAFDLEQRLFCIMPLVHSESLALQERAVELAVAMVDDAPPVLRERWRAGAERTAHYCSVIRRFGRFPHRNAVLGRRSSPEELAFLAEETKKPSPLAAAAAAAAG